MTLAVSDHVLALVQRDIDHDERVPMRAVARRLLADLSCQLQGVDDETAAAELRAARSSVFDGSKAWQIEVDRLLAQRVTLRRLAEGWPLCTRWRCGQLATWRDRDEVAWCKTHAPYGLDGCLAIEAPTPPAAPPPVVAPEPDPEPSAADRADMDAAADEAVREQLADQREWVRGRLLDAIDERGAAGDLALVMAVRGVARASDLPVPTDSLVLDVLRTMVPSGALVGEEDAVTGITRYRRRSVVETPAAPAPKAKRPRKAKAASVPTAAEIDRHLDPDGTPASGTPALASAPDLLAEVEATEPAMRARILDAVELDAATPIDPRRPRNPGWLHLTELRQAATGDAFDPTADELVATMVSSGALVTLPVRPGLVGSLIYARPGTPEPEWAERDRQNEARLNTKPARRSRAKASAEKKTKKTTLPATVTVAEATARAVETLTTCQWVQVTDQVCEVLAKRKGIVGIAQFALHVNSHALGADTSAVLALLGQASLVQPHGGGVLVPLDRSLRIRDALDAWLVDLVEEWADGEPTPDEIAAAVGASGDLVWGLLEELVNAGRLVCGKTMELSVPAKEGAR